MIKWLKKHRNILLFIVNALFILIVIDDIYRGILGYHVDKFEWIGFAIIAALVTLRELFTQLIEIVKYCKRK